MPDKVAFVSAALIWLQPLPGKQLYLPLQKHLLLAENEFTFAGLWETLVSAVWQDKNNKHKQKASEQFSEGA